MTGVESLHANLSHFLDLVDTGAEVIIVRGEKRYRIFAVGGVGDSEAYKENERGISPLSYVSWCKICDNSHSSHF